MPFFFFLTVREQNNRCCFALNCVIYYDLMCKTMPQITDRNNTKTESQCVPNNKGKKTEQAVSMTFRKHMLSCT